MPSKVKRWFPLESNPEVMSKYVAELGLDTSVYEFHDVFSTEDWALSMVPRPVVAVLLLFPLTDEVGQLFPRTVVALFLFYFVVPSDCCMCIYILSLYHSVGCLSTCSGLHHLRIIAVLIEL